MSVASGRHPSAHRGTAAAAGHVNSVTKFSLSRVPGKTTGDLRLDERKFGIPRRAIASRPAPKRIDRPRRGLNDISVLSKSRYGHSLSPNRAVNLATAGLWVPKDCRTRGEFTLVAPLLLATIFPTIDFGFAFFHVMQVQNVAQVGAQYASVNGFSASSISAAVTGASPWVGVSASPAPTSTYGCATT